MSKRKQTIKHTLEINFTLDFIDSKIKFLSEESLDFSLNIRSTFKNIQNYKTGNDNFLIIRYFKHIPRKSSLNL